MVAVNNLIGDSRKSNNMLSQYIDNIDLSYNYFIKLSCGRGIYCLVNNNMKGGRK